VWIAGKKEGGIEKKGSKETGERKETRRGKSLIDEVDREKRRNKEGKRYPLLIKTHDLANFRRETKGERRVSENRIDF